MTPYTPRTHPGSGALDLEVSAADREPMIALVTRATGTRTQWRPATDHALDHLIEDLQTLRQWLQYGSAS